jgi:hypothetical protein
MYWNDLSQPYAVGERVQVKEAVSKGRLGHVTAVRPENAFSGEDALYTVTFDGETASCPEAFSSWQLELIEEGYASLPNGKLYEAGRPVASLDQAKLIVDGYVFLHQPDAADEPRLSFDEECL